MRSGLEVTLKSRLWTSGFWIGRDMELIGRTAEGIKWEIQIQIHNPNQNKKSSVVWCFICRPASVCQRCKQKLIKLSIGMFWSGESHNIDINQMYYFNWCDLPSMWHIMWQQETKFFSSFSSPRPLSLPLLIPLPFLFVLFYGTILPFYHHYTMLGHLEFFNYDVWYS